MIIKKFTGKNENEARAAAVKELGAGVVIMNVKTVKPKGLFSFLRPSTVEVTAAIEEETDNPPAKKAAAEPPKEPVRPRFKDVIEDEEPTVPQEEKKGDIEAKLESIHSLIEEKLSKEEESFDTDEEPSPVSGSKNEVVQFLKLIYNTLIENEVDEKYANELLGEIERMNRPGATIDYLLANIYQKMILSFGQASTVQPAESGPRIVYFIGPTGVGKTTTIAKVASILSVTRNKKVALITTDTYRIAAAEQLKTYANILNVPFRVIYTEEEMVAAYRELENHDFILVDTAGHSPKNDDLKANTKKFLHALDELAAKEVYLVLSATTKYKDLKLIADMYKEMDDYKLIFTKLDETGALGNLWNIKRYTDTAIGYVTTGQNVPGDIQSFNPQATVKQLLGGK